MSIFLICVVAFFCLCIYKVHMLTLEIMSEEKQKNKKGEL
jgi:hypothetical protein